MARVVLPFLLEPSQSDPEILPQYGLPVFHQYARYVGFIKLDSVNFLEWAIQDIYLTTERMLALCTSKKKKKKKSRK